MNEHAAHEASLVVCVHNDEYPVALEVHKIYEVVPDPIAAGHGLLRVIDESGADYLYPATYFAPIELPQAVRQALHLAA